MKSVLLFGFATCLLIVWYNRHMYLQQQVVDGSLHLQGEAVAGIVLAECKLVIDAEDGDSRDSRAWLRGLLVLLTSLQDFDLQLLQLCPES